MSAYNIFSLFLSIFFIINCFLPQQVEAKKIDSPSVLIEDDATRQEIISRITQYSKDLSDRAEEAVKKKNLDEAIKDCKLAIDICPMNDKAYILLTIIYLMTGQEKNMYDVLTTAGRSYPEFDNIVDIIDDNDLTKIPRNKTQSNVFLARFPEKKKMAISFMFDDGEENVYHALPIFEKYGFRVTIPVIAGHVAYKNGESSWGTWKEWKDAADRGFEIANHSMDHRSFLNLHGNDFDTSIDQAKDLIERNIGHKVTAFIFPYDSYTDEGVSRALRFHQVVRTPKFLESIYSRTVNIVYGGPRFSVNAANRLVDIAVERRLWLVANCHGVTEDTAHSFKPITPEFLDAHLAYIHSKADDIWVDTFSNVFNYLNLRNHTKIVIKNSNGDSIDFMLQNGKLKGKIPIPLTVVVKVSKGVSVKSVSVADGHALKAWSCTADRLCVDADVYDENIHLQWG